MFARSRACCGRYRRNDARAPATACGVALAGVAILAQHACAACVVIYHVMKHYDYESPFPNGFSSGQRQKGCTYIDCLVFKFQPSCNEISSVEANKGGKFTNNLCMDISFLQLPSHMFAKLPCNSYQCAHFPKCNYISWPQILLHCVAYLDWKAPPLKLFHVHRVLMNVGM